MEGLGGGEKGKEGEGTSPELSLSKEKRENTVEVVHHTPRSRYYPRYLL